ncbi:MAG: pyridoxal 5'-phosphate synthase [Bacteroidota bacterium]
MKSNMDPLPLFLEWYNEELALSKVRIPSAVCLSTVGAENFPNARFVSFKEVIDESFIITGPLNSRKGIEINSNKKVALTFWWTATERQIRIQGLASRISEQLADIYFKERNPISKAVSLVCEQGKESDDLELLKMKVLDKVAKNSEIVRPRHWGGISIYPVRIEFMEFKTTRFHRRTLFEREKDDWNVKLLQP